METKLAPLTGRSSPQLGWRAITLGTVTALALLAAGAWRADLNLVHAQEQIELEDQAHKAELALSALLSTLKDAETGQRGYLLTGDEDYLQPYAMAWAEIGDEFNALNGSGLQDSRRRAGTAELRRLATRKLDELRQTIVLYNAGDVPAAMAIVRTNLGEQLMEQIRALVAVQRMEIQQNLAVAERPLPVGEGWVWVGMLVCAALLLLGGIVWQQVRVARYFISSTNRLERFTRAFGLGLGLIRTASGFMATPPRKRSAR
jgi:CHASE3 domain sensor protein